MGSPYSFRPTLFFTKLELVYLLVHLLKDISLYDDAKRIEMVECRHYLNLIKDKITAAAYDGSLKKTLAEVLEGMHAKSPDTPTDEKENSATRGLPSLDELKKQFPFLSEDEIKQVIDEKKRELEKPKESKSVEDTTPPPMPKSIVQEPIAALKSGEPTKQQLHNKECAKDFAQLLGT